MEESTKMVSGRRDEKCFLTTQFYGVPSGRLVFFVSSLAAELNDIQIWKRKNKCVIIFQTIILQHVRIVNGANFFHKIGAQLG